ncbi:MAG: PAS domain S-box protein [Bacteroidia bacterium]
MKQFAGPFNRKNIKWNKTVNMKSRSTESLFEEEKNLLLQDLAEQKSKRELAEQELKKSESLLNKTELIANIGYWNLDLHTYTFSASDGAKRIYGITQPIITIDDVRSSRLHEYDEMLDQALKDLIAGTKPYDVIYKIKRKADGAILSIHSKADYHKESHRVFGIISDITEQTRQIEQISAIEQKWKSIIQSTPVPMAINDKNGHITFLNAKFTEVFGYSLQDIPTVNDWFLHAYPDINYREQVIQNWNELVKRFNETGTPIPASEYEITCKNGDKKSALISNASLGDANENDQLIILYDITERKNAKEKELEYLQVLEGVLNSINVRVFWKDKNLHYLGCNQNFAKDAGFDSVSDIIGKNDYELAWKDQAALYQSDDQLVLDSGISKLNFEEPQTTPQGNTITLLTNKIPLLNSEGTINGIIGTYLDISKRKEQEMALATSQLYLQAVLQSTNDGILAISLSGQVLYANDRFAELTKIPKSIIQKGKDFELLNYIAEYIEDGDSFRKNVEELYDSKEVKIEKIKFKDGRTVEHNTHPLILGDETIGRVWSIRDITERVLAEAQLRQKDEEFQKLSFNVSDLIFQFTRRPDGSYFVPIASHGIKNIFGCNPEDVADNFEPIARVIHPDDMERVINEIENSAKNLSFFTCEFRVQIPGREVQWIYSKSNPERLPDGSITWYGFNTDITSRIKSEERLLQLSEAVEQSPVTIVLTDLEGKIQYANPTFSKTTGYTLEEAIGQNPRILKSGETPSKEYKELWDTISSGKKWTGEFHNKDKYGKLYWESATIAPVIDKNGIIKNYLAIKIDISENKKAQIALEESNKRYNLISKATHDTIWDLDLVTGKLIHTENELEQSKSIPYTLTQLDWLNLIHPDDLNEFKRVQEMALLDPQSQFWEHEYRMLNIKGQFSYVNSKGYIVRDAAGKAIRIFGASQDISERMTHLKAIEAQNKQLQEIAWIQSHIVRAPLARIMGLIHLLKVEEEIPDDLKELLNYLLLSAEEFDEIIKTISNKSQVVETRTI